MNRFSNLLPWVLASCAAVCLTCPLMAQTAESVVPPAPPAPPAQPAAPSTGFDFSALMAPKNVENLLTITDNLREASASLDGFGQSLTTVAQAADSVGGHMASMSREFDPFGFKQAFQTIQQQNRTIRKQHQRIESLLQQEIDRWQQNDSANSSAAGTADSERSQPRLRERRKKRGRGRNQPGVSKNTANAGEQSQRGRHVSLSLVPTTDAKAQTDPDPGSVTEQHVMIPMRDNVRLSAYLYMPEGAGPWPAVFEQRYASLRADSTRRAAARLAAEGFVVALVNFRGTHLSEGTWVGYRALQWGELQDGYDVCEWLAERDWCTGRIGTFGSSQGGYAQNYLAVTQPPHLVCQHMTDTGLSLFHEGYRVGGTTRPDRFRSLEQVCRDPSDNRALLQEWLQHPNYDDYWKSEDCTLHFDRMNVPCFTIGSWYDFMNQGSIASFQGRQHLGGPASRGTQQLIIGPWLHGRNNKGSRVGDLQYPENATWPEHEHMVRWFNHHLKGVDNGVTDEPAVRYYVMGAVGEPSAPGNEWRTASDFPPAATSTSLFLRADGRLSDEAPQEPESATSFASDPRNPMQIPGTAFPGAKDARDFEQQADVRTFTTQPLSEPLEWTGRVNAEMYLSSTAPDTDIIVRISDVYPDGRSILIMDYPWRVRYREGFDRQVLMTPGEVSRVAFPVGWISQIFNTGHRIRVTISSTGAPLYEPNAQNGKSFTLTLPDDAVSATHQLHHSQQHASRIIAPVVNPTLKTTPAGDTTP